MPAFEHFTISTHGCISATLSRRHIIISFDATATPLPLPPTVASPLHIAPCQIYEFIRFGFHVASISRYLFTIFDDAADFDDLQLRGLHQSPKYHAVAKDMLRFIFVYFHDIIFISVISPSIPSVGVIWLWHAMPHSSCPRHSRRMMRSGIDDGSFDSAKLIITRRLHAFDKF